MSNSIIQKRGKSGVSGYSGDSGTSGYSGYGTSGYSGYFGFHSDGNAISGYSGYNVSGYSGYSGDSGTSGYSGYSGKAVGWSTWSPSITWGGTTPSISGAEYYRYNTIGTIVFIIIYFTITPLTGTTTSASISLPATQKDVEVYLSVNAKYKASLDTYYGELNKAYIDAKSTSGKLELGGLNVTSATTFMVSGYYEIE